jgi:hypothetical protein
VTTNVCSMLLLLYMCNNMTMRTVVCRSENNEIMIFVVFFEQLCLVDHHVDFIDTLYVSFNKWTGFYLSMLHILLFDCNEKVISFLTNLLPIFRIPLTSHSPNSPPTLYTHYILSSNTISKRRSFPPLIQS